LRSNSPTSCCPC